MREVCHGTAVVLILCGPVGCGATSQATPPATAPMASSSTDAVPAPLVTELADEEDARELASLRRLLDEHPDAESAAHALVRIGELEEQRGDAVAAERALLAVACPAHLTSGGTLEPSRLDECRPMTVDRILAAEAWGHIMGVHGSRGDTTRALAAAEMALRVIPIDDPRWRVYRRFRALELRAARRYADATTEYAAMAEDGTGDGTELRHIGIMIADRDWDGDADDDPVKPLERPEVQRLLDGHPTLAPEILWYVADELYERTEYTDAIEVLEELLRRAPSHPRAAESRARIAEAERAQPN